MKYTLYHSPGTGSEIIHAALCLGNAPYRLVELDYEKVARGKAASLKKVNSLSRLPTLVSPRGNVLTESGAILVHLAHTFPKVGLIPKVGSSEYDLFFRLLFILTGEIYPCFTFMDDPSEWIRTASARESYRGAVLKHQKEVWLTFSRLIDQKGPWALGKRFSAIDLYLASMTRWRPRVEWFRKYAPRILAIAERTRALKALGKVYSGE